MWSWCWRRRSSSSSPWSRWTDGQQRPGRRGGRRDERIVATVHCDDDSFPLLVVLIAFIAFGCFCDSFQIYISAYSAASEYCGCFCWVVDDSSGTTRSTLSLDILTVLDRSTTTAAASAAAGGRTGAVEHRLVLLPSFHNNSTQNSGVQIESMMIVLDG